MTDGEGRLPTSYGAAIGSIRSWCATADDLLCAAAALRPKLVRFWKTVDAIREGRGRRFPRNNLHRVYFMLVAFALENLLKAALINSGAVSVAGATRLPGELNTHDLPRLARRTNLALGESDRHLLEELKRDCEWFGRYPVPAEAPSARSYISYGKEDSDRLLALVRRVRNELGI
jgi:hypothetical protein